MYLLTMFVNLPPPTVQPMILGIRTISHEFPKLILRRELIMYQNPLAASYLSRTLG